MQRHPRKPMVHYPAEIANSGFTGKIYGYFHTESNVYNIVGFGEEEQFSAPFIGEIHRKKPATHDNGHLEGYWENENLVFRQGARVTAKKPYELLLNIFSRNSGILESDQMADKSVVISGLGSVGSLVALELARAGVRHFLLLDNDIFEYHNISRHQCGIADVGKFKVSAVEERILQINPIAKVNKQLSIIEEVPEAMFRDFIDDNTVIVGCADNREGDLYANRISCLFQIPFLSIGFWERAFAGEIFYSIPGKTPCYACVFGGSASGMSSRVSANRRFYTHEENLADTRFEPGISIDINYITTIGVKMILDFLNRKDTSFTPRLLDSLEQFTLICNTNDPKLGGERAEIFSHPLQITRSIKVNYDASCSVCGQPCAMLPKRPEPMPATK